MYLFYFFLKKIYIPDIYFFITRVIVIIDFIIVFIIIFIISLFLNIICKYIFKSNLFIFHK